jgi:hypothetical protein
MELGPAQDTTLEVTFHVPSGEAFVSELVEGQLVLAHVNHPARDLLALSGQIWFPNLTWPAQPIAYILRLDVTTG